MVKELMIKLMATVCAFFLCVGAASAYATWIYPDVPSEGIGQVGIQLQEFVYKPKETLHISAVTFVTSYNVSNDEVDFAHPTTLSVKGDSVQTNSSITYKVTVFNNTDVTYWYLGPSWDSAYGANSKIGISNGITIRTEDNYGDNVDSFNASDWIPPRTMRDFYITYRFGSNAGGAGISTKISLDFGVKMDAVQDEFLAILNDTISANGYHYLASVFDERYKEDGSTVIANVGDDKAIFDTLFGGTPTINIDGKDVPVTIMIQRDNVDSLATGDNYAVGGAPTGCEYTLYITVDPLNSPTGEAMVYAVSYSCGGEGDTDQWYQLGQLYQGKAPLTTYDSEGNVAFDVDNWTATANEYEFIDGYYYKVGYEQGDQYAKYNTIEQLMSANDQNFYNDIDNSHLLRKVYEIVYNRDNYGKPGYDGLRAAFEKAKPFYNVYNGGQEVKIKREATRAELLTYIVAIQTAYEYYNQFN